MEEQRQISKALVKLLLKQGVLVTENLLEDINIFSKWMIREEKAPDVIIINRCFFLDKR